MQAALLNQVIDPVEWFCKLLGETTLADSRLNALCWIESETFDLYIQDNLV